MTISIKHYDLLTVMLIISPVKVNAYVIGYETLQ